MDSLFAQHYAGHNIYYGGRETSLTHLPSLKHPCALGVTQPPPPHHGSLCAGRRTENKLAGGVRGTGGISDIFQGARTSTGYVDVLQIPLVNPHRNI